MPGWALEEGAPSGDALGVTAPGNPRSPAAPRGPVRVGAAAGTSPPETLHAFILFLSPLGRLCAERVKPVLLR